MLPGEAEVRLEKAAQAGDVAAECLIDVQQPWRRTIAAEIAYDLALPLNARPGRHTGQNPGFRSS
jgi:hypothetical protein